MNVVKIKCNECGLEFEKYKGEYDRHVSKGRITFFCSLKCGTTYTRRNQEIQKQLKYSLNKKTCLYCKSELTYECKTNKFCDQSCAAKFNNFKKITIKTCLGCHINFRPNRANKIKFCSKKCSDVYRKHQTLNLIKSGLYKPKSCQTATLKKHLIEMRGYKCESCKNDSWMNQKICLTLNHINGDATDNHLVNLQLLCWNCHSMTPNFGAKNKNGTRFFRKERYVPVSSKERPIIRNNENVDSNSTTGSNL